MDSARTRIVRPVARIGASYRCLRPQWSRKRFESAPERRRPDLNRGARICSPLPNHSATAPRAQATRRPSWLADRPLLLLLAALALLAGAGWLSPAWFGAGS